MPRLASARLAAQLQKRVEDYFYGDTATYYAPADAEGSQDAHGQPPVPTESTALSVECSFSDKPSKEVWADYADIQEIAGEIRHNTDFTPEKGGQFIVTGRFDELTGRDQVYEIVDIRDRGAMGFLCLLKFVTI